MSIPTLNSLVPNFSLPDRQGHDISLWDYKHQQPVILVLCAKDNQSLLRDFTENYSRYRNEGAEVLAIVSGNPGGDFPFPVLIDSGHQIISRLADRLPTILVLDSYNELYARLEGPWPDGPDHQEILKSIAQVEMKCPECGVPEWPDR